MGACSSLSRVKSSQDCTKPAVMSGQQDFLVSSEVLQHTLLPLLSAADLVRLGITCKALMAWVSSTFPTVWQVHAL